VCAAAMLRLRYRVVRCTRHLSAPCWPRSPLLTLRANKKSHLRMSSTSAWQSARPPVYFIEVRTRCVPLAAGRWLYARRFGLLGSASHNSSRTNSRFATQLVGSALLISEAGKPGRLKVVASLAALPTLRVDEVPRLQPNPPCDTGQCE
jgi:hypothetical protein